LSEGCPGQNKNYTVIRFLYLLVQILHIFDRVIFIFLIEGHSYLLKDQDVSIITKQKKFATVETQEEWDAIIENCREKPSPFSVVRVNQEMIFDIKKGTDTYFLKFSIPAEIFENLQGKFTASIFESERLLFWSMETVNCEKQISSPFRDTAKPASPNSSANQYSQIE
jgi:hypothetical protein